jgi:hypothetical protein
MEKGIRTEKGAVQPGYDHPARGGQTVPLPAALDVVVTGGSGEDMGEVFEAAKGTVDA